MVENGLHFFKYPLQYKFNLPFCDSCCPLQLAIVGVLQQEATIRGPMHSYDQSKALTNLQPTVRLP